LEKDISNFRKRSDRVNSYSSWCNNCKKDYDKIKINKKLNDGSDFAKVHKQRKAEDVAAKNAFIKYYLEHHSCISCGESDIEVLDFDHRVRSEKEYSISNMSFSFKSIALIKAEIAKCDVRCGNCHRHKTMHESNSWRAAYCTRENCEWSNA
jgi:hypothetical protein